MTLGELLRKKREERNMSLNEMAQLIGISPPYLYRLEQGIMKGPSVNVMMKIVNALDISEDEIQEIFGKNYFIKKNDKDGGLEKLLKFIDSLKIKKEVSLDDSIEILKLVKEIVQKEN